jgi:very-short-patch-repair endonuclease
VIFLSMVKAPMPNKRLSALTMDIFAQRFNVATSRAKDQLWLYHSMSMTDLGNKEDLRFRLLDYCYGVVERRNSNEVGSISERVPEDLKVAPFDSLFEQRVFNRLVDRGLTVVPQFDSNGYKIDLVIIGGKNRLAIECDGDYWHGPEHFDKDLARQRDLERCGWTFFRIRESSYYVDTPGVLQKLWAKLELMGISPSSWGEASSPEANAEVHNPVIAYAEAGHEPVYRSTSALPKDEIDINLIDINLIGQDATGDRSNLFEEYGGVDSISRVDDKSPLVPSLTAEGAVEERMNLEQPPGVLAIELKPYNSFSGSLPQGMELPQRSLIEGVIYIVEAEGPILGQRIHEVFRTAAGIQRMSGDRAGILDRAIAKAVATGQLIAANPLNDRGGHGPKTFRLPNQAVTSLRKAGPRALDQIPPSELAELMRKIRQEGFEGEDLIRATLVVLDQKRLTSGVKARLTQILAFVD